MPSLRPVCPRCRSGLPDDPQSLATLATCPHCQAPVEITVLPAFGRGPLAGSKAEKITGDDEAACFFHPSKKAVVPCDRCGRFLCALCDLPLGNERLCPNCLQTSQGAGGPVLLERFRVRWDRIVWITILLPFFACWPITPLTGLIAAGLAVWRFKEPPSRVVNSRARLVAGALAGVLVSAAGVLLLVVNFSRN